MKRIVMMLFIALFSAALPLAAAEAPAKDAAPTADKPINIGFLIFPGVYQLDVTGPYCVFTSAPNAKVHLIWKDTAPVVSADKLVLTPTVSFADSPQMDVIIVPGGGGTYNLLEDEETLNFIKKQAKDARYISSVCTGSLLLAAADLLDGYKATTHWFSKEQLEAFGVEFVNQRVVIDRNRATAAGVSAGIDLALTMVGEIWSPLTAQEVELMLEYDPQPPFKSGNPAIAPKEAVETMQAHNAEMKAKREEIVKKVIENRNAQKK